MLPINGVPSKHTTDYYYLCGRGIAGAPNTINIPQLRMLYCYYIRYCCWLLACLLLLTLAVRGECEKKPIASKAINGIIIPQTHSIHSDLCDVCVCVCYVALRYKYNIYIHMYIDNIKMKVTCGILKVGRDFFPPFVCYRKITAN